jgi:hypothetical protein
MNADWTAPPYARPPKVNVSKMVLSRTQVEPG